MNTKDPMLAATTDNGRELFTRMSAVATGFPREHVVAAATNLLINAIRQDKATRQEAEIAFNELFGRSKQVLLDHYDIGGRKKGIFPYDQVIRPDFFQSKNKF